MGGLQLACRFSYTPNKLGHCGSQEVNSELLEYITDPIEEKGERIKEILQEFYYWPYLKLIAKKNKKNWFDDDVIEAYWLGNSLLDKIERVDLEKLVRGFGENGLLPEKQAEEKANSISDNASAHHSFHVLHLNLFDQSLAQNIAPLDKWLVKWGEVRRPIKEGTQLLVESIRLAEENNEFKLVEEEQKIDSGFVFGVNRKEHVATHWKKAIVKISEEQLENLKKYTVANLK